MTIGAAYHSLVPRSAIRDPRSQIFMVPFLTNCSRALTPNAQRLTAIHHLRFPDPRSQIFMVPFLTNCSRALTPNAQRHSRLTTRASQICDLRSAILDIYGSPRH